LFENHKLLFDFHYPNLAFGPEELPDLDSVVSTITIHGDRYTAEEQRRVER
jgi:hypothetical protein